MVCVSTSYCFSGCVDRQDVPFHYCLLFLLLLPLLLLGNTEPGPRIANRRTLSPNMFFTGAPNLLLLLLLLPAADAAAAAIALSMLVIS